MLGGIKMRNLFLKLTALFVVGIFVFAPTVTEATIYNPLMTFMNNEYGQFPSGIVPPLRSISEEVSTWYNTSDPGVDTKYLPSDYDISKFLMNNEMEYQKVWEPWLTKAAVRCIETDASKEFLAVGGGYLYDNEIHIYRWNGYTRNYDKVWDSGDQIIQDDVISIDVATIADEQRDEIGEEAFFEIKRHIHKWYVIHTYSSFEKVVKENLQQRLKS